VTETAVIEARRIPQAAAATLAQPQPALRPSTARLSDQRSLVAAVETVRDVLVVPAPAPVNALPPIVSDDAVGAPAAGAGGGRLDAVSAAGPVGRPQLIAVLPPPVAREIGPVLDRRRSVAATATPVAAEVDAPAVDAFTLPVPAPVPRPASLESNPDTPPAQAAVQTDRPETKARSSAGRPRAKARSRAEARKARARWRKAPRRARRTQRAVQSQQNPGRARLKPESGASSGSMAARMIQGWTREWTTPLRVRPRPAQ
jgi:hypothetical protein